jgi:hypothetical protein
MNGQYATLFGGHCCCNRQPKVARQPQDREAMKKRWGERKKKAAA